MEPCELCKVNNQPNCGNDHCHTRSEYEECVWVVDCGSCGSEKVTTWKKALEDGCPICCSYKISIYHKKNQKKK